MSSRTIGRIIAAIAPPLVVLAAEMPAQYRPYAEFIAACLAVVGGVLGWSAPADAAALRYARALQPRGEK